MAGSYLKHHICHKLTSFSACSCYFWFSYPLSCNWKTGDSKDSNLALVSPILLFLLSSPLLLISGKSYNSISSPCTAIISEYENSIWSSSITWHLVCKALQQVRWLLPDKSPRAVTHSLQSRMQCNWGTWTNWDITYIGLHTLNATALKPSSW